METKKWVVEIGDTPETTKVRYGDVLVGHLRSVSIKQTPMKVEVFLELDQPDIHFLPGTYDMSAGKKMKTQHRPAQSGACRPAASDRWDFNPASPRRGTLSLAALATSFVHAGD